MVVLAIVASIGIFSYDSYSRKNKTNQNRLHAEEVIRKMTVWTTVEKKYPADLGEKDDQHSLVNTISADTRERLVDSIDNPGSPSNEYPYNIEVYFCYRPTDPTTPVGAKVYYWDLQEKVQKYQHYGNSEETGVMCQP